MEKYKYKEENGILYAIQNEKFWERTLGKKYKILLKQSNIPNVYWNLDF